MSIHDWFKFGNFVFGKVPSHALLARLEETSGNCAPASDTQVIQYIHAISTI